MCPLGNALFVTGLGRLCAFEDFGGIGTLGFTAGRGNSSGKARGGSMCPLGNGLFATGFGRLFSLEDFPFFGGDSQGCVAVIL